MDWSPVKFSFDLCTLNGFFIYFNRRPSPQVMEVTRRMENISSSK